MIHPERKLAKRFDTPNRSSTFTKGVYSGACSDAAKMHKEVFESEKNFYPEESEYNIYFGEMHGHTNLSDGFPNIDEYFENIINNTNLDFAAVTDHDHGGVGKAELWDGKWDIIKQAVKKYYVPGKFTTILGYERDSYPWYNNMAVYYNNHDAEMFHTEMPGEINAEAILELNAREDMFWGPHDTDSITAGSDLSIIDLPLLPPLIELYSRGDCVEYFGNPYNIMEKDDGSQCEGGYWQDALKRGAKMGCYAGSDDHCKKNGLILEDIDNINKFPGITGVLAKENTLDAIFEAIKSRRCYATMGGNIWIDFRIDGHYMGEEYDSNEERSIYYNVKADAEIKQITIVKNCRDYIRIRKQKQQLVFDYKIENEVDYYYLRVELVDGRAAWTSPIWINSGK